MNTVKSFWIGWGSLIVAGAGAYFVAKREINADRREKHLRREAQRRYNEDIAGHPSEEVSRDPAPTRHPPENPDQEIKEKSKYEAQVVYRHRPGDKFS